jgi:RNA polymerase sigma factor (sigma-70 family)
LGYDPIEKSAGPAVLAEHAEIIDALQHLEENDRTVMVMRYVDGLDPKDIAAILDESANVISVRLNRATKRLQTILHI